MSGELSNIEEVISDLRETASLFRGESARVTREIWSRSVRMHLVTAVAVMLGMFVVFLAACGGYICGHSGLSEAALLISKEPFVPHIRISQGRNSFRPYLAPWLWYAKATLPGALRGFKKWIPDAPTSGG